MNRTRPRRERPARSSGAATRVRARELAEAIRRIASATEEGDSAAEAEIVDRLWGAWVAARRKHARHYLMSLILLAKRAMADGADGRAAVELARRLRPAEARARIPGLPAGKSAQGRLRREVERLAKLEPRGRGRPRKGEPKPRFYKEVLRALPALGIEPVTERQLIRDWRAAVAEARANGYGSRRANGRGKGRAGRRGKDRHA
jgi:hypothetical protein